MGTHFRISLWLSMGVQRSWWPVERIDRCTKIMYDKYMRCALYCRVSTTDQNCEMQLRELREYISRRGWKGGGEYIDTGFSGAKASRPALDRLMADAAQHKFDCIAVYKIDRFGRSVLHLNQQLAALHRHQPIAGHGRKESHQPTTAS